MSIKCKKNILNKFLTLTTALIFGFNIQFLHSSSPQELLKPAPLTNWSKKFNVDYDPNAGEGFQVLHFSANKNRHYTLDPKIKAFVEKYFSTAKHFTTDAEVLRFACDSVSIKAGAFLEMGTGAAKTTNFIAALKPHEKIHTFDSFEGLPETWDKGSRIIEKKSFALLENAELPPVLNNVRIYVGKFEKVLPDFKKHYLKEQPIAFLNIDSDIYSSAKTTFDILGDNIVPGTVIYFDELYNYPHFEQGEWKALQEFIFSKSYELEFLAINANHEQAAVRIKEKPGVNFKNEKLTFSEDH